MAPALDEETRKQLADDLRRAAALLERQGFEASALKFAEAATAALRHAVGKAS